MFAAGPEPQPFLAPLDIVKLVGFATGAALHFYLCWMLFSRYGLRRSQRVLLALGVVLGFWHLGNFAVTIYELLDMSMARWWPKSANIVAYSALVFLPPLLAHAHFKLLEWFDPSVAQGWGRRWLKPLAGLGYLPTVVLPYAIHRLWQEPNEPPIQRLGMLLLPFMLWFVFIFLECAAIDWRLVSVWQSRREKQFFRTFALTMLGSAALFFVTYVLGAWQWGALGRYLDLLAKLSSIVPTAIVAYYIYRYRYFELVLRQSVIYAVLAAVIMMTYIYGIRRLSLALYARYDVRSEVVEALLILVLIALAEPLRRVTENYLRRLFTREVGLYRELVAQVGAASASLGDLTHFIAFAEQRLREALELNEVQIIPSSQATAVAAEFCQLAEARQLKQIEDTPLLAQLVAIACYALWREGRVVGLLIVRGQEQQLTAEKREVLAVLAGHIAVAIENCQLLEEKVKLERELAERERLASLGQMAATVAHEVKNPLSAIKSIVQVMREDENVAREYNYDLNLITGEVDRLSRSVSQLLSFSRPAVVAAAPASLRETVDTVLMLTRAEAEARAVRVEVNLQADPVLNGETSAALKEILLNLTLNALQAIEQTGTIQITSAPNEQDQLQISLTDTGAGVPADLQEKIFDPFFTTKQRGTGLGLAIVARRMRELGGTITCQSPVTDEGGTRFDMVLPLSLTEPTKDSTERVVKEKLL
jgi:signal transduction histidine kinase